MARRDYVDLRRISSIRVATTCRPAGFCEPIGTSSQARRLHHDRRMPIHYAFDRLHRRLVTHADGVLTFHEISAHLNTEQRNRDLDLPELIDARGATTNVTPDQVRQLVDRAVGMLRVVDLGATAIVTTTAAPAGMARMYSLLAGRAGIAADVFPDVHVAAMAR